MQHSQADRKVVYADSRVVKAVRSLRKKDSDIENSNYSAADFQGSLPITRTAGEELHSPFPLVAQPGHSSNRSSKVRGSYKQSKVYSDNQFYTTKNSSPAPLAYSETIQGIRKSSLKPAALVKSGDHPLKRAPSFTRKSGGLFGSSGLPLNYGTEHQNLASPSALSAATTTAATHGPGSRRPPSGKRGSKIKRLGPQLKNELRQDYGSKQTLTLQEQGARGLKKMHTRNEDGFNKENTDQDRTGDEADYSPEEIAEQHEDLDLTQEQRSVLEDPKRGPPRYGAYPESNQRREMEEALVEHNKAKVLELIKTTNSIHDLLAENDCDPLTVFDFIFMSKLFNFCEVVIIVALASFLAKRPAQKKLEKFIYDRIKGVFQEAKIERELEGRGALTIESLNNLQNRIERRMKNLQEKIQIHRRGSRLGNF